MTFSHAIAIGGSAGSLPVLTKVLAQLPPEFPAPVLVVVHVGANGRNLVAEAFAQSSALPVTTATEDELIKSGHVYVAPADHHLMITGDHVQLGRGPRENFARPALDPLFRSLALAYGPGATGIVLSGYLNDGAAGLSAITRCGGTTVVQNPSDAMVAEMPLGALETTNVDYRCDGSDIAELLKRIVSNDVDPQFAKPSDIALEVDIALGRPCLTPMIEQIGRPIALSCPACGGVLSEMDEPPLRYRCQVGHAYTAKCLASDKEGSLDEALRVALRIVEERSNLSDRMAKEAGLAGRHRMEGDYLRRAEELRTQAEILRSAALGRGR